MPPPKATTPRPPRESTILWINAETMHSETHATEQGLSQPEEQAAALADREAKLKARLHLIRGKRKSEDMSATEQQVLEDSDKATCSGMSGYEQSTRLAWLKRQYENAVKDLKEAHENAVKNLKEARSGILRDGVLAAEHAEPVAPDPTGKAVTKRAREEAVADAVSSELLHSIPP